MSNNVCFYFIVCLIKFQIITDYPPTDSTPNRPVNAYPSEKSDLHTAHSGQLNKLLFCNAPVISQT